MSRVRPGAIGVGILGVGGVLASYAKFLEAISSEEGSFFGGFVASWRSSFEAAPPFAVGLQYDLVATYFIVLAMAVLCRKRLGAAWMIASILASTVLGVCAGLAVIFVRLAPLLLDGSASQSARD